MMGAMPSRPSRPLLQSALLDGGVLSSISRTALDAGRILALRGSVCRLSMSADGRVIEAETLGSAPKPYRQRLTLVGGRGGQPAVMGTCTCPVGFNCKHVAAVLVAARLARPSQDELSVNFPAYATPTPTRLPFEISAWLESLEGVEDTGAETYPEAVRQRLLYVLDIASGPRNAAPLRIACYVASLRKNGELGASRPYAPHRVDTPARYLRPSDRLILRRLTRLRHGDAVLEADDDPLDLLRRIIATGRARWNADAGPAVSEGPVRPGRVTWRLNPDGTQQAALELNAGLVGFCLRGPWYADPAANVVGPVDTGLPQGVAARLLAAPPIPAEAAPRVAAELARRLPALTVPAPAELAPPEVLRGPVIPHLRLTTGTLPFAPRRTGMSHRTIDDGVVVPLCQLSFRYGPLTVPFGLQERPRVIVQDSRLYGIDRDRAGEQAALARLGGIGFARIGGIAPVYLVG